MVNVAAAQPRFDMGHGNLPEIGSKRCNHGGQRTAMHYDPVGPFAIIYLTHRYDQPGGQSVKRRIRLHALPFDEDGKRHGWGKKAYASVDTEVARISKKKK